jgi:hypothetical protein
MFEHVRGLKYVIVYTNKALKSVGESLYAIGQKHSLICYISKL